jgi:hypothetical protein
LYSSSVHAVTHAEARPTGLKTPAIETIAYDT